MFDTFSSLFALVFSLVPFLTAPCIFTLTLTLTRFLLTSDHTMTPSSHYG